MDIAQLIIGFILATCSVVISIVAFFGALKMYHYSTKTQTDIQTGVGVLQTLVSALSGRQLDIIEKLFDAFSKEKEVLQEYALKNAEEKHGTLDDKKEELVKESATAFLRPSFRKTILHLGNLGLSDDIPHTASTRGPKKEK